MPSNIPLQSPAQGILEYLAHHQDARDTIEGIRWWVLETCIQACLRRAEPRIAEAVAQLVEQEFIEQERHADGRIFYRISPRYLAALQQQPSHPSEADENDSR